MSNNNDPIVQTKTCPISGNEFSITQWDLDFYNKISPTFAGQKFQIPTPTRSPDERQRRRLGFRNERNLYRRTCDASGKQIISIYSPDKPYKVYDQKIWWSDSRDGLDYGREFDFGKTFTEQFGELMRDVPRLALQIKQSENSEYTNLSIWLKDCYLSFGSEYWRNYMYSTFAFHSSDIVDSYWVFNSEHIFNSFYIEKCNTIFSSSLMQDCSYCYYCDDCIWCSMCIECNWLQNKSYCYQNKQLSKEEFDRMRSKYVKQWTMQNSNRSINRQNENVVWKRVYDSKNCNQLTWWGYCEDVSYSSLVYKLKDSYDCNHSWFDTALLLESESVVNTNYGISLNFVWWPAHNIYYSDYCYWNNSNLFWCIWLRNKQYCIFNKQYTKEEYEKTVAQIITHMQETGEWGEFFDPSLSPFWYNETVAQEYYPSTKTEITQNGYKRSDYEVPTPVSDKVIQAQDLPESIEELQDDILHFAIACEVTGKLFRIQPQELAFYRKHNIPVPRKHPDQRHLERLALRK